MIALPRRQCLSQGAKRVTSAPSKQPFACRGLEPSNALAPEIRLSPSHPYKHSKDDEERRQILHCDPSATSSHSRTLLFIHLGIPKNNMFAALVVHLSFLGRANTDYSTHVYLEMVSRRRMDSAMLARLEIPLSGTTQDISPTG